jgi:prepilin-type N-terminal cleavage/methylation domain-containing protein
MLMQKHRGFTLIELLVSVVIMVAMMVGFGIILTYVQKTVSTTQNQTRSNQVVQAIAANLRRDFSQLSKNGFLCITQASQNDPPILIFSKIGIVQSKLSSDRGTGAVVSFGQATDGGPVLYQPWVLCQNFTAPKAADIWAADFSAFQVMGRIDMNTQLNSLAAVLASTTVTIPVQNMNDVQNTWQVIAEKAESLSIQWTDGSMNNNGTTGVGEEDDDFLNWYDISSPRCINNSNTSPALESWELYDYASENVASTEPVFPPNPNPRSVRIEYSENGAYRALWTHQNQNNWPRAVKIRFNLMDDTVEAEAKAIPYEIIISVE